MGPPAPPLGGALAAPGGVRAIRVITWNARGGDPVALAAVMLAQNVDIAVLQEVPRLRQHAFYQQLMVGLGATYTLTGPVAENMSRTMVSGEGLHPPEQVHYYAVVTLTATVTVTAHALVDYATDAVHGPLLPRGAQKAGELGYNQRPPHRVAFTHQHLGAGPFHGVITPFVIYSWHAPIGLWNARGLELFDTCDQLAQDLATGDPVLIGADMNTDDITGRFNAFTGIQRYVDYLLAANIHNNPHPAYLFNGGWPAQLMGDAHLAGYGELLY